MEQSLLSDDAKARPPERCTVVLLGAEGAGKSALAARLISDTFDPTHEPNVCDRFRKQETVDGHTVVLEIVDCGGSIGFARPHAEAAESADCLLCVYSVTSISSLREARQLCVAAQRARSRRGGPPASALLVAAQCDSTEDRCISARAGRRLAARWPGGAVRHVETSSRTGEGVAACFHAAVRAARRAAEASIYLASSGGSRGCPSPPSSLGSLGLSGSGCSSSTAGSPPGSPPGALGSPACNPAAPSTTGSHTCRSSSSSSRVGSRNSAPPSPGPSADRGDTSAASLSAPSTAPVLPLRPASHLSRVPILVAPAAFSRLRPPGDVGGGGGSSGGGAGAGLLGVRTSSPPPPRPAARRLSGGATVPCSAPSSSRGRPELHRAPSADGGGLTEPLLADCTEPPGGVPLRSISAGSSGGSSPLAYPDLVSTCVSQWAGARAVPTRRGPGSAMSPQPLGPAAALRPPTLCRRPSVSVDLSTTFPQPHGTLQSGAAPQRGHGEDDAVQYSPLGLPQMQEDADIVEPTSPRRRPCHRCCTAL
eukprot:TRINITY_DN21827_c0_g1_i2.p1 TRINITY_DN21827_c0_g1~~TRINITY_DN21827_c0_g1_i2.p1  ORF type:complete len:537 (+),score=47.71 TRINITY_DN21827_c0_g1_i2:138-1748(+)